MENIYLVVQPDYHYYGDAHIDTIFINKKSAVDYVFESDKNLEIDIYEVKDIKEFKKEVILDFLKSITDYEISDLHFKDRTIELVLDYINRPTY